LLTDAEIEHDPGNLTRPAPRLWGAGAIGVACGSIASWDILERLLVPPFVFVFQNLFPFCEGNDGSRPEAAAADGNAE